MRKVICVIIIVFAISTTAFAGLTAPYFGINFVLDGSSYFSLGGSKELKGKSFGEFGVGYDLKLGKEIFFLGNADLTMFSLYGKPEGNFPSFDTTIGVGLGVGYYIFDYREDNKGHSLTVSLSAIYKIRTLKESETVNLTYLGETTLYDTYTGYGGRARVSYYYNFKRNFALMAGVYLDVHGGKVEHDELRKVELGTLKYDTLSKSEYKAIGIDYGIILGMAF